MKIAKKKLNEIEKRIDKLNKLEIALDNFDGYVISITRLTVIKYLCRDCLAMIEFAYFISNKVNSRIKYSEDNISLETQINESLQLMKNMITDFTNNLNFESTTLRKLDVLRKEIKDYQNIIEKKKWSDIRIIQNWDILLIEESISCFVHFDRPEMGYQLAKSFTEKYNARFGTGLLPESLECLKEINSYWKDYLYKLKK
jgi:hypothetical protein